MPIHHAKVKKAANLGIVLTLNEEAEGEEVIRAHIPEHNIMVTLDASDAYGGLGEEEKVDSAVLNSIADNAMEAVLEIRDFQKENPTIRIRFEDGDYVAYSLVKEGRKITEDETARDPELADLFETLREQAEGAHGEEDESEDRGSVVPERYKKIYAERGDPTHCGDWLALTLNSLCKVLNEKGRETTDLDRLETIANANGVTTKMPVATPGYQGRYRMCVRNQLTKRVAATGVLFVPEGNGVPSDTEMKAPREWILAHSPKPKEAKAKTEKKEKAA